jgi:hypothetical protein
MAQCVLELGYSRQPPNGKTYGAEDDEPHGALRPVPVEMPEAGRVRKQTH